MVGTGFLIDQVEMWKFVICHLLFGNWELLFVIWELGIGN